VRGRESLLLARLFGGLLLAPLAALDGAVLAGLGAALAQPGRFADAVAQVVELGAADAASAFYLDLGNARRVNREDALHALALDTAPHREALAHALAAASDHSAGTDLDALLLPFENALVDIDSIADLKLRDRRFEGCPLHKADQLVLHDFCPLSSLSLRLLQFVRWARRARGSDVRTSRVASGPPPGDCRSEGCRAPPCRERRAASCTAGTPAAPPRYGTPPSRCPGRRARRGHTSRPCR